jgi:hypothetical protein
VERSLACLISTSNPVDVQKIRRLGCLGGNGIQNGTLVGRSSRPSASGIGYAWPLSLLPLRPDGAMPSGTGKPYFELLGVLEVESGLEPSTRGLTSDCFFNFLQDFQAILDHELYSPLREIIHFLGADPEEGLPVEFVETLQPRLFSSEEFEAVSLLLSQKLI